MPETVAPGEDAEACVAKILDVDFGGADCLTTIAPQISGSPSQTPSLVLRRSNLDRFTPGSLVLVSVTGEAHIFPR